MPATPLGIMALLDEYGVALEGKRAVVIGRSTIVGKPAALLLLGERDGDDLPLADARPRRALSQADVLVAAVGKAGGLHADMVKPGAAVIDVGMNRTTRDSRRRRPGALPRSPGR